MKKLLCFILGFTMVLGLFAGCASSQDEDDTDYASMSIEELRPLIKTVTDGKLTAVTCPDLAPYEFYSLDKNGKPTLAGFDMALAQYIADYIGLELEMIPMDFDGTITELGTKKADMGMAAYSPDPARENAMDFSDIYYSGKQSFVTVKDKVSQFPTLEDANNAAYQIGAQVGSIQYGLALQNTPDADIVQLSKVTDIIAELLSGKLDGAFVETIVAESYSKNYPDLAIALDVPYDYEGYVVGVSKGNGPLLAAINLAIAAAIEDGSMAQFVYEANELASSNTYEGLLDDAGQVPETAE